jgi:peptidoglycan hydrolase-like protein with peptidoglycan-binding domain
MSTIAFADMKREDRANLQKAINQQGGYKLIPDGAVGPATLAALKGMQKKFKIPETGLYDDYTQGVLASFIASKYLNAKDYKVAADTLGAEVAAVRAVCEVEARGAGFLPDGRCLILFERHKFWLYLSKNKGQSFADKIAGQYPDICNRKAGGYLGKEAEWPRLERAMAIDANAALMSASWGLFQIMGFNFKAAGFPSVETFVAAMKVSERDQLKAFVSFIQANPTLLKAIRAKQWAVFAENYNGENYAINEYDTKMATAYDRNKPWNLVVYF